MLGVLRDSPQLGVVFRSTMEKVLSDLHDLRHAMEIEPIQHRSKEGGNTRNLILGLEVLDLIQTTEGNVGGRIGVQVRQIIETELEVRLSGQRSTALRARSSRLRGRRSGTR